MDPAQRYMLLDCKEKAEGFIKKSIIHDPHFSVNYHLVSIIQSTDNDIKKVVENIKRAIFIQPMEREYWLFFLESIVLINDIDSFLKYTPLAIKSGIPQREMIAFESYFAERLKSIAVRNHHSRNAELQKISNIYKMGKFVEAEQMLIDLVSTLPMDRQLWEFRSIISVKLNKISDAIITAKMVSFIDFGRAKSWFSLGIVLWLGERQTEAEIYFIKAIAICPTFDSALFQYSRLIFEKDNSSDALYLCKKSIILSPFDCQRYVHLMRLHNKDEMVPEKNRYLFFNLEVSEDYFESSFLASQSFLHLKNFKASRLKIKSAIIFEPKKAEAWYLDGLISESLQLMTDAGKKFRQAIILKSNFVQAHLKLANIFESEGAYSNALRAYRFALALTKPEERFYSKIGIILTKLKSFKAAENNFKMAICYSPTKSSFYETYADSRNPLLNSDHIERLFTCSRMLYPLSGIFFYNYGNYHAARNPNLSRTSYLASIIIDPSFKRPYFNMANSKKNLSYLTSAIKLYHRALTIDPNYVEAAHNLGLSYLANQQFDRGFYFLEYRWGLPERSQLGYDGNIPLWRGEKESMVIIWREQGIGDEILYSSLFLEAFERCDYLTIQCDQRLTDLFRRSFPDGINFVDDSIEFSENEFKHQIPIASLPVLFRKGINCFSGRSDGWLKPNLMKVKYFREKLVSEKYQKVVGLSWRTFSRNEGSYERCIDLVQIASILDKFNFRIVNLQYGNVCAEISELKKKQKIELFQIDALDIYNDIDSLAAAVCACDFVVTIDNSTAHLAGALGVDCHLLLPKICDDRWGHTDDLSYWYKSLRLYRQKKIGDWRHPLRYLKTTIWDTL